MISLIDLVNQQEKYLILDVNLKSPKEF